MSTSYRESGDQHTDGQHTEDIAEEQKNLSTLYGRLDDIRELTRDRVDALLLEAGGTPAIRTERESVITMLEDRLNRLGAVEAGLCFGRLDFADGVRRYIGRIGLFPDSVQGDAASWSPYGEGFEDSVLGEPMLVDWRAPAARPFYLATAAAPDGVFRRRHLRTRLRTVTGLHDEVLDLAAVRPADHADLTSEAVLLAALSAGRTGRMTDIVETIQAEQDQVIRAEMGGVLVVQGGPGTGKTAVALHRAAYLLYTHRRDLSQRGVLIVGPNATFLRYISQVLPAMAETGVLLGTVGELFPGVRATLAEPAAAAEVKGRIEMAEVIAAAVRNRQLVPPEAIELTFDGEPLSLDPEAITRARERARRSGRLHNLAKPLFHTEIVETLARQVADRVGADPLGGDNLLGEDDLAEIRRELRADGDVRVVLDWLWPTLTPQELLTGLYGSRKRIAAAAPGLTGDERELLFRPRDVTGWTPADAALLDEAAELLGEDDTSAAVQAEQNRLRRIAYAQGVLDITLGSQSLEADDEVENEVLTAHDLIDADHFAQRQVDVEQLTAAQRAASDRRWAFGHVIVDEAQELSPMAWRLLMRRCPSRSMTIVGDVAQTGALSGASSWEQVLAPYVADRWRLAELTVSYRTPAEIMAVAGIVLSGIDPSLTPPRSVREAGVLPWGVQTTPERRAGRLAEAVLRELDAVGEGRLGVIVPDGLAGELGRAVLGAVPDAEVGEQPDLEHRVVALTVRQAKGLEFDSVIVVEPALIAAESPRGRNDLYVALTRATRRLGVIYSGQSELAEKLDVADVS